MGIYGSKRIITIFFRNTAVLVSKFLGSKLMAIVAIDELELGFGTTGGH